MNRKTVASPQPNYLTDAELAFHTKVINKFKESSEALQNAQATHAEVSSAFRFWRAHLLETYELSENGLITEDGEILPDGPEDTE